MKKRLLLKKDYLTLDDFPTLKLLLETIELNKKYGGKKNGNKS